MSDWTTLAANSPFVVSVTSSCRRVPSRWPSLRRSHSTRAVGNSALMNPIAMSRESVPCGCQQPPKETLKARVSAISECELHNLLVSSLHVFL